MQQRAGSVCCFGYPYTAVVVHRSSQRERERRVHPAKQSTPARAREHLPSLPAIQNSLVREPDQTRAGSKMFTWRESSKAKGKSYASVRALTFRHPALRLLAPPPQGRPRFVVHLLSGRVDGRGVRVFSRGVANQLISCPKTQQTRREGTPRAPTHKACDVYMTTSVIVIEFVNHFVRKFKHRLYIIINNNKI